MNLFNGIISLFKRKEMTDTSYILTYSNALKEPRTFMILSIVRMLGKEARDYEYI